MGRSLILSAVSCWICFLLSQPPDSFMEAFSLQNREKAGGSAAAQVQRPEFIQAQVVRASLPVLFTIVFGALQVPVLALN